MAIQLFTLAFTRIQTVWLQFMTMRHAKHICPTRPGTNPCRNKGTTDCECTNASLILDIPQTLLLVAVHVLQCWMCCACVDVTQGYLAVK